LLIYVLFCSRYGANFLGMLELIYVLFCSRYGANFLGMLELIYVLFCSRYGANFLGMLESPADGLGCWNLVDTTVVTLVGNATFPAFAKLCNSGYGSRPSEPSHTIIAVNPEWTSSRDVGQPWDR
jgi:hypothetical protein